MIRNIFTVIGMKRGLMVAELTLWKGGSIPSPVYIDNGLCFLAAVWRRANSTRTNCLLSSQGSFLGVGGYDLVDCCSLPVVTFEWKSHRER